MKLLASVCLSALALVGCSALDPYRLATRQSLPIPHQAVPDDQYTLTEEIKRAAIDMVWHTINERHVDARLNGVDWKAVRARYEPVILAQRSEEDFWRMLDKMTGELNDSHTRVNSPTDVSNIASNRSVSLGVGLRRLGDEFIVTRVSADSDAHFVGIRPGMALLAVDGKPALEVFKEVYAQTRGTSTEHAKVRRALARMLFVRSGDSRTVRVARWRLQDGRVVNDERVVEAKLSARESVSPPTFASRVLPSGVAYVTMSGWSGSLSGRLQAAITAHASSPALIIDLRDNPGGSADMVQKLLQRFVNAPTKLGTTGTRSGQPVNMFFGLLQLSAREPTITPVLPTYEKPTVILVNEASASASELFSAAMQDLMRAVVMGERTCGCLTAFFGYQALPGGGSMAYSELAFKRSDGRIVEGNGVVPDKPLEVTREDIALGRDVMLEAAVVEALNLSSDQSKSIANKTKVATQN